MPRTGYSLAALAALAATLAASCVRSPLPSPPGSVTHATPYVAQFDSVWTRFDSVYPSFAYKRVDWRAQRARYRPRAAGARSQDELVAVLLEMLSPLRDRHVWLVDPRGQVVPSYKPGTVLNFDPARWSAALHGAALVTRSAGVHEAMLGGYGYLFLGTWKAPVDGELLDAMLLRLRDTQGLIIDLRTNAGGSDAAALTFASRFTRKPFTASYVEIRTDPRVTGVEMPLARTIAPRGPFQYTRPVVLITGRGGLSATETFVAAMRTLPQVTVIGDTTGGASGNPATFSLGNGWQFTVPRWLEFGPDRQPIEGRGVAPHLAIAWTPARYVRERDPLIDAAVGLLGERTGVYRMAPAITSDAPPRTPEPGASPPHRQR
ncbi:S41 family peptidase [Gemmatimonas sp.]|jgi:hypothetical protein|uniref:S41 family peptidase n=1 Tax=Gemmatimonas sp. TaxID=1962908 RepID=UPI0037BE35D9